PLAQPYLNAFPVPNGPDLGGGYAEFHANYSIPTQLNATSLRIDQSLGKWNLFARYNYSPSDSVHREAYHDDGSLTSRNRIDMKTQTLTAGATWTVAPSLVNDLRFNWSRAKNAVLFSLDGFGGAVPPPDSLMFPSVAPPGNATFLFFLFDGTY